MVNVIELGNKLSTVKNLFDKILKLQMIEISMDDFSYAELDSEIDFISCGNNAIDIAVEKFKQCHPFESVTIGKRKYNENFIETVKYMMNLWEKENFNKCLAKYLMNSQEYYCIPDFKKIIDEYC